ncbi:MAG: hypothetical protein KAR21_04725 [Spirochaetales bacterium]|nr:hypothetical protein [Spirochaetales bacterium]
MRNEIINQYSHFWRMYRSICKDFDPDSWKNLGFGLTQPDRLALHILQSTIFYIEGKTPFVCLDGTLINTHSTELDKKDLPDLDNILFFLDDVEKKTESWIRNIDFDSNNEKFPWTGESAASVVLFVLRHSQYHLGEMNSLLNEQLNGNAKDHFANQL